MLVILFYFFLLLMRGWRDLSPWGTSSLPCCCVDWTWRLASADKWIKTTYPLLISVVGPSSSWETSRSYLGGNGPSADNESSASEAWVCEGVHLQVCKTQP